MRTFIGGSFVVLRYCRGKIGISGLEARGYGPHIIKFQKRKNEKPYSFWRWILAQPKLWWPTLLFWVWNIVGPTAPCNLQTNLNYIY